MPSRRILSVCLAASALLALPGACSGPSAPPAYDRSALLDEVAHQVIIPGYQAVADSAAELHDRTGALCEDPSGDTLAATRDAWKTTFSSWQRTEAYGFGPARDDNLGPEMAFWPTDTSDIESVISGNDDLTANAVDALGSAAKGLYALEYLLFAEDDALPALSDTRRCKYVDLLANHVERTSQKLVDAWKPEGGDFAGVLATAGQAGNPTYPAELSAISALLTELLTLVENVKDDKLGDPLGVTAMSEQPDPTLVESPYAHQSLEAMKANMKGFRSVWNGTKHNFDAYLRTRDEQVAEEMLQDLKAVDDALDRVPPPFFDYVGGESHDEGVAARDQFKALQQTIATDVETTLAVSLMFNSNDGD